MVSWNRSPVIADRGVAAQEWLGAVILQLVVVVLLLVAACGQGNEPANQSVSGVRVVPLSAIVPLNGGADIPDASHVLLREADSNLRAGNFDAAARAAHRAREGATTGTTKCLADAIGGIADYNRGRRDTALQEVQQGECAIGALPPAERKELGTTLNTALYFLLASKNDNAGAASAAKTAVEFSPERKDLISAELCQATKQPDAIALCAGTTTEPTTTTTPTTTKPTTTDTPTPTSVDTPTTVDTPTSVPDMGSTSATPTG
jgi:tetratricopeptide (TPR) repeat protein